jgi:acetate kinase
MAGDGMSKLVAVVNTGESSLKIACYEYRSGRLTEIERTQFGLEPGGEVTAALQQALDVLPATPDAFGHRFVNPGPEFRGPVELTPEIDTALESALQLAPVHNAVALCAIRKVAEAYPAVPCVVAFDTSFHANRPMRSTAYALPKELVDTFDFQRYGFHGFAHESLADSLAAATRSRKDAVSAVTLQLGAGCSACAIRDGQSIETSMGFSPLEGLVMANRAGSIDPTIVLALVRAGYDPERIEQELNRRSGLRGLSGSSDMREVLDRASRGDKDAARAIDVYCHHIVLTAGAYLTLLGGDGAVVFGGGTGSNAPEIRARVADGLAAWNIELDPQRNSANAPGCISAHGSRPVYVFRTDEEIVIARSVAERLFG